MIFRVCCDSLRKFLKSFIKHYPRFSESEWYRMLKHKKCKIHTELKKYINAMNLYFTENVNKLRGKKGLKQETFKNNVWTHQNVIDRFLRRIVVFNQIVQGDDLKQDVFNGKYKGYLKMGRNYKYMRLKAIECQWKHCKNKNGNKRKKFRKCKGCRLCRYCSKKCQKLDWNRGCHKEMCGLFTMIC